MSKIFISYRRDDSGDVTGRLYDWITNRLGAKSVFRDVDDIPFGVDFKRYLEEMVSKSNVMLVIIGPHWATITEASGTRRLDNPRDFVRIEVETALNRNIPVIPLLVSGAVMPDENSLPPSLAGLAYRNGMAIRRDPDFRNDMERLLRALEGLIGGATSASTGGEAPPPAAFALPMLEWCAVPVSNLLVATGIVRVEAFCITKYPVTNEQFRAFLDDADGYSREEWWGVSPHSRQWHHANPQPAISRFTGDQHPREMVNWYEAIAFCRWLSAKLAMTITLPTDHQWHLASQGAGKQEYPWGNGFEHTRCNTKESGINRTTPVAKYPHGASPFGVLDMLGNVWELTLTEHDTRANSLASALRRTIRGCSWHDFQTNIRSAARGAAIDERTGDLGFRIVATETI
jgi:hypothetical protein